MRFNTGSRLLRNGGTASGVVASNPSQRSRMWPWDPAETWDRACAPSYRNREVSRSPILASLSPSRRNRPVCPSSTCCNARGAISRHALTSRQLVSVSARDMERNASLSRPMPGRTSLPSTRHSAATSYDLYDSASISDAKTSTSQKGRFRTRSGLTSKNLAASVLDFHVPLYRERPRPAQRGMYCGLRLVTMVGLALKNATASVGESWDR